VSFAVSLEGFDNLIEANEGDLLLDALIMAGAPLPYSCQQGNCGTCKCELVGKVDDSDIMELEYSEYALSPEQRAKGIVLACRTQVWNNLSIRRVDDDELVVHPSRVMQTRVAKIEHLTHDITGITLKVESGGPFGFSAGQYASVTFAAGLTRDYSMSSTPDVAGRDGLIEFQVRVAAPNGARSASRYARDTLREGDSVRVSGPMGTSYWREKHVGPMLLVGGGSGFAPMESIAATALASGVTPPIHLYFGARAGRDLYRISRLKEWAAQYPNFKFTCVLSEPSDSDSPLGLGPLRSGLVMEAVLADIADFSGFKCYLAGPPVMVEAGQRLLEAKGVATRDIHADAFYTDAEKSKEAA
jgi:naphthalene 1,2-dioxygenase ferredoxin reductase component